jgi:hypothetical protein
MILRDARFFLNNGYLIKRKKSNIKISKIYREKFYDQNNKEIELSYEDIQASDWIKYFD